MPISCKLWMLCALNKALTGVQMQSSLLRVLRLKFCLNYFIIFYHVLFDVRRVCASQGPRVARAAALKAKKEAIGRLQAIKDDIQQKNLALVEQLENKKAEARRVRSSLSPIGGRLEEIQRLAEAWSSR